MTTTINTPAITLNPKQVEAEYGIPVGTLANMRWRAEGIRFYRAGRAILYRRADIEAWLETQAVEPGGAGR